MKYGFTLSSEELPAQELINLAAKAEATGFDFVGISDHFHPWVENQGQSPFVWTTLGGISQVTSRIEVFVEVTCPIMRYHPAIVAQAAATAGTLLEGRFALGLGTGEYLNEHITAQGWPHISVRQEMLAEAIQIIRELWQGQYYSYAGKYFKVEEAKIYSLPNHQPPIIVSGIGPESVSLAAALGDGLVSLAPNKALIDRYHDLSGGQEPAYGQIHVCHAPSEEAAKQTAFKYWPNAGISGQLASELRLPAYFEQAAEMLDANEATKQIVLGPNPKHYLDMIDEYAAAGYDHIYLHQIGPNQSGFIDFAGRELLPLLKGVKPRHKEEQLSFRETLEAPED